MKHDERKRTEGRPSMRRELMELFRDTRSAPPKSTPSDASEEAPEAAAGPLPAGAAPGPSRFLRRFLQESTPTSEPCPSGLPALDAYLGGGFGHGLHLLVGASTVERTAFLDSLAWEAAGDRRPVMYYALESGTIRLWERLMTTMGAILDVPDGTPAALRGRELTRTDRDALARLDAALQTSVLPYLSLIDAAAGNSGTIDIFIEDLRMRVQQAAERHGRLPLVLVDDLGHLLALTGAYSLVHMLSDLDAALRADSLSGLVAAASGDLTGSEPLPVSTWMALEAPFRGAIAGAGRVDLVVRQNAATGWIGTLPLLLDPFSGLFADAG